MDSELHECDELVLQVEAGFGMWLTDLIETQLPAVAGTAETDFGSTLWVVRFTYRSMRDSSRGLHQWRPVARVSAASSLSFGLVVVVCQSWIILRQVSIHNNCARIRLGIVLQSNLWQVAHPLLIELRVPASNAHATASAIGVVRTLFRSLQYL